MNCEKVRDLITAYIDGELNEALQKEVELHISMCKSCKQFEETLRRVVVAPLRRGKRAEVPEYIWHKVRDSIEKKRRVKLNVPELIKEFPEFFRFRMPKPALVTVTAVLLLAVTFAGLHFRTQHQINTYIEEQVDFFYYLASEGEVDYLNIDEIDLGTAIENYLL